MKMDSIDIEVNIDKYKFLKDLKELKDFLKDTLKILDYEMNRVRLKRKDVLILKTSMILHKEEKEKLEKYISKKLKCKVIAINKDTEIEIIER